MAQPQTSIFCEASTSFHHLEYTFKEDVYLTNIQSALKKAMTKVDPSVHVVVALGPNAKNTLLPELVLSDFNPFTEIKSRHGKKALATQGDLLFWIHSESSDLTFEQALQIQHAVGSIVETDLDISGFAYRKNRDLIGFVDGTANPKEDARQLASLIPDDQPGAGGSFVLSQKWCHDLRAFNRMPVPEQEAVVGRTKEEDVELEGDAMPENSHVSRTDVSGMKIYRRSSPFGNASEHGLYFLAFACEQKRFTTQLERMYGIPDGITDRLIDFSDAVSGAYWFAPSQTDLDSILS